MDFVAVVKVTKEELFAEPAKWRDMLYQNKVLVLKGLYNLTPEDSWNVHAVFGTPWTAEEYRDSFEVSREVVPGSGKCITTYSNINTKGRIGDKSLPWHHDIPWHRAKRYPVRTLYPVKLEGQNVTTNFCDADAIWKRIPKSEYEQLAQADVRLQYWYEAAKGNRDVPTKVIPLVERHPHTKRYSVMLNSFGFDRPDLKHATSSTGAWIVDCWSRSKRLGLEYLNRLHELVCTPDNIYEHRWEHGDLVLFDNYSGVMHGRDRISDDNTVREFWRVNIKHYWQDQTVVSIA